MMKRTPKILTIMSSIKKLLIGPRAINPSKMRMKSKIEKIKMPIMTVTAAKAIAADRTITTARVAAINLMCKVGVGVEVEAEVAVVAVLVRA